MAEVEITRSRSQLQMVLDFFSEMAGFYRIFANLRGGSLSFGAKVKSPSLLQLGNGVVVQHGVIIHCGGKSWSNHVGGVQLEDGVNIGPHCVIYGAGGVVIESFTHLGPGVKLITQGGHHDENRMSHRPTHRFEPIKIGPGSWIGAGTVLTAGARIGRRVTVAPNSVVSTHIADFSVVAGNPARLVMMNSQI